MLDNLQSFFNDALIFFSLLILVILTLLFLKRFNSNRILFKINIYKFIFTFSFIYLIMFIMISHNKQTCDELNVIAKCQCYALKLSETKMNNKIQIAEKANKLCPSSTLFQKYLSLKN